MSKIEIDGNEYKVLDDAELAEWTHTMVNGKVKDRANYAPMLTSKQGDYFGVKLLRLLPKVPVEFVGTFAKCYEKWFQINELDDVIDYQNCQKKTFRCVEVVE